MAAFKSMFEGDSREPITTSSCHRAFAVKVEGKRLPVFPFSGFDLYHHFRNDAFYDLYNLLKVRKTGKREVVFLQPLPQTLYLKMFQGLRPEGQGPHLTLIVLYVTCLLDDPKGSMVFLQNKFRCPPTLGARRN